MSSPLESRVAWHVVLLLLAVALAGCDLTAGGLGPAPTTVTPTDTPTETATPTATSTAIPTATFTTVPTATPTGTATPSATSEPTATATAAETATPTALPTSPPIPTAVPTPEPTSEPAPELTPTALSASAELVTRVEPGQGEIALLFNGDSFAGHISTILDATAARGTTLTFFLTGGYLERYPDEVRAIDAAGHEIASHGYDHVDFRDIPDDQIVSQIDQWRAKFAELTGKVGPSYWQPPFGYTNGRVQRVAAGHGLTTVYWTRDVLDAVSQPKSKQFVLDRVQQAPIELDGAIFLMHVDKDGTIEALPEMLDWLAQRGLRVVTVSELLRR